MTFNNLKLGELFQFDFDKGTKWAYKKTNTNEVECIGAPNTEKGCLNRRVKLVRNSIYAKVKIIPGC